MGAVALLRQAQEELVRQARKLEEERIREITTI